ncbi:FAD:protein FMN transferase [Clostridium sp. AM58-1XD]|uniref:FAD:protein FMN transferase n=1 Tax=Clostridium sp. AM58-1XD TaxID=2292307 RepID=UPI000E4DC811|nr:FAD:protein FMN transferase [Clostridium sp. AM58-1XD]RGY99072.1 FAD:protein FMN transferase [Clostridium sp. AM58-1XD]
MSIRKWGAAALSAVMIITGTGCGKRPSEPVSMSNFLLNTVVTVTLYDSSDSRILEGCMELCREYEGKFSKTIETSEIYRLNHREAGTKEMEVSPETAELIRKGLYYSEISDGAFDITIEPLSSLWDFKAEDPEIPDEKLLKQNAEKVNYKNIRIEGNTVEFLSDDVTIDLGAIAKGYIADKIKEYLLEQNVRSAVINLGGNVLCVGRKPDGKPFKVGLQKPFKDHNEAADIMALDDMSMVVSGVYERHFVKDGVNYHHILNPKTGWPYENGLTAVTIFSSESVDGDGLSTTCFSLGMEKGMELINSLDGIYAVFQTEDGNMYFSEGAKELEWKD